MFFKVISLILIVSMIVLMTLKYKYPQKKQFVAITYLVFTIIWIMLFIGRLNLIDKKNGTFVFILDIILVIAYLIEFIKSVIDIKNSSN